MTLMIVDDNASIRKMVREMCSEYFETIYECSNGLEALNNYEISFPDFVLMDIKMPVMNGINALKEIMATHPDAKIIMITQFDDKEIENEAMNFGAYGFLLKENLTELEKLLTTK